MEIIFEKIPYEDYLAFFKAKTKFVDDNEHWLKIQYDYLKEPSWVEKTSYDVYCPDNLSIQKGKSFIIPTGFKCETSYQKIICVPYFRFETAIPLTKNGLKTHLVIRGTTQENHCFQAGDRLIKLIFEE